MATRWQRHAGDEHTEPCTGEESQPELEAVSRDVLHHRHDVIPITGEFSHCAHGSVKKCAAPLWS